MCGIHSDGAQDLQPRKGSELLGRVMATPWEGGGPILEPGAVLRCAHQFESWGMRAWGAGGRKSILFWKRGRKRELVRIIVLCHSLKLDFLCY